MKAQTRTKPTMCRCSKEDKIDTMEKQIRDLNEMVIKGTNGDSLMVMTKQTMQDVGYVKKSMTGMKRDIGELKIFKTETEAQDDLKKEMRKNRRWSITTVIAVAGLILTIIATLIIM